VTSMFAMVPRLKRVLRKARLCVRFAALLGCLDLLCCVTL
jgi:hypothetical protein